MSKEVILSTLSVEALAIMANEASEQVKTFAGKTVQFALTAGRALLAIKDQLPHGEWEQWVEDNYEQSYETAARYMRIAKVSSVTLLDNATSISDALRIVADSAADSKTQKSPSVEVIEPEESTPAPARSPSSRQEQPPAEPSQRKPSASSPKTEVFDVAEHLDGDRSLILDAAADYIAAKKLKHFVAMLRKVADDLEATIS